MRKLDLFKKLLCSTLKLSRLFALLVAIGMPAQVVADRSPKIYFYSSDINTSRNILLKSSFDQYLSEAPIRNFVIEPWQSSENRFESTENVDHGRGIQIGFQPVAQFDVFEKGLLLEQPLAFIIQPDVFEDIREKHKDIGSAYKTELQGLKQNSDTYQKLLLGLNSSEFSTSATVASSSNKLVSKQLLMQMLPNFTEADLRKVRILKVPKDMDAIMSVTFGLADFAISAESSFQVLVDLYKEQYEKMKVLGTSRKLKRHIVVMRRDINPDLSEALRRAFLTMKSHQIGMHTLGVIGLDDWTDARQWQEKEGKGND